MRIPKFFQMILLYVFVLLLASCSRESDELGGVPVTPEMLESVSRSIAENNETEPKEDTVSEDITALPDVETTESTEATLPDIVYWTESGTVYHLSDHCGTLRHSEHILQGSVEEAILAKKERVCKSCS